MRKYIHTYIHIYTYIHTYMHTYIHAYIHTYIHIYSGREDLGQNTHTHTHKIIATRSELPGASQTHTK